MFISPAHLVVIGKMNIWRHWPVFAIMFMMFNIHILFGVGILMLKHPLQSTICSIMDDLSLSNVDDKLSSGVVC